MLASESQATDGGSVNSASHGHVNADEYLGVHTCELSAAASKPSHYWHRRPFPTPLIYQLITRQHRQNGQPTPPIPTTKPVRALSHYRLRIIKNKRMKIVSYGRTRANMMGNADTTPDRTRSGSSRHQVVNLDTSTPRREEQPPNVVTAVPNSQV